MSPADRNIISNQLRSWTVLQDYSFTMLTGSEALLLSRDKFDKLDEFDEFDKLNRKLDWLDKLSMISMNWMN